MVRTRYLHSARMILSDFTPRPHHRPQEPAIPLLFPPPLELVAVRRLPCHFPTLCNKRKHSAFTLSGESVRMGFAVFEDADAADQTVASKEAGPRPAVQIGVPNGFTEISKPVRLNTSRSSSPAPCATKPLRVYPAAALCSTTRTARAHTLLAQCRLAWRACA